MRYHAALVQLLHGRWREGFANFESRLTAPSLDGARTFVPPPYPRWRGGPPDGGLLVLFTEQGRGDVPHEVASASLADAKPLTSLVSSVRRTDPAGCR